MTIVMKHKLFIKNNKLRKLSYFIVSRKGFQSEKGQVSKSDENS